MGRATRLHGYIINWIGHASENLERLATLPEREELPIPLTRDMFAQAGFGYSAQLIAFGRQYNGVELHWSAWRSKFEDLLRTLYWNEVHVYLETEFSGTYHFWWQRLSPEEKDDEEETLDTVRQVESEEPTRHWTYDGVKPDLFR